MKKFTLIVTILEYGQFLGKRYGNEPHIIWVSGEDVRADHGGDYLPHYPLLAEGLLQEATGGKIKCDQPACLPARQGEAWDKLIITYHPDGTPMKNSSQWFTMIPGSISI